MRQLFMAMLLVIGGLSCSKDKGTVQEIVLTQKNLVKVEGPTTVRAKDSASLVVSYPYSNGCDVVSEFEETRQGNTLFIKAMGGYPPESICTQDAGIRTKAYVFVTAVAGTYELRFLNRDGSYISHMVVVN